MRSIYWILFVLLYGCSQLTVYKTGLEGQQMPEFKMLLSDSVTLFNTKTIPLNKPSVLISFEPWCPYCRAQTQDIIDNIKSMEDVNFYLITTAQFSELRKYYNYYKLYKYPTIVCGVEQGTSFENYFKSDVIPYIAIYGKGRILKRVIVGKARPSMIRRISLE